MQTTLQYSLLTPSGRYPAALWAAELRVEVVRHLARVFGTPQDPDLRCEDCGRQLLVACNFLTGACLVCCEDPACGSFVQLDLSRAEAPC